MGNKLKSQKRMRKMRCGVLLLSCLFMVQVVAQEGKTLFGDLGSMVDMVVAQDGSGDYSTIQGAIDAVPDWASERTVVFVKNGTYREKVLVGSSKRRLTLVGEDADSTILVYDDYAGLVVDGVELNTFTSQTIRVDADDFRAMNMTFENDARTDGYGSGQNVAISTYGARAVLLHCKLISWQDTYFTGSNDRHYLKDCYIEGAVDYIFGNTTVIFDSCQIQTVRSGGYITAASTEDNYNFGYVFFNCRLTAPPGISGVYLGRPWKNSPRTVFFECVELDNISSQGWRSWNADETSFYAEYNCSGEGSDTTSRVDWSHQLTDAEADAYTMEEIFSAASSTAFSQNWDPALESDSVWLAVQAHAVRFLDPVNTDARIESLLVDGEPIENWDPSVYEVSIEVGSDPQEMPVLTATAVNPLSEVDITYPDDMPGFSEITVLANDGGTHSTYRIYFSVEGSYSDARLDSIRIAGELLEGFSPDIYEYDVELPEDVSKYWGLTGYARVGDAWVITRKPESFPGDGTIEVTAVDGTTTALYTLHFTQATGMDLTEEAEPWAALIYPVREALQLRIRTESSLPVRVRIFQLSGTVIGEKVRQGSPGISDLFVPLPAQKGVYLFEVVQGDRRYTGQVLY
jgi:pectinesterase